MSAAMRCSSRYLIILALVSTSHERSGLQICFRFHPAWVPVRVIRNQLVFSDENAPEARSRCRITRLVLLEQIGGGIFRSAEFVGSMSESKSFLISNGRTVFSGCDVIAQTHLQCSLLPASAKRARRPPNRPFILFGATIRPRYGLRKDLGWTR
jgi:hypothetical protein